MLQHGFRPSEKTGYSDLTYRDIRYQKEESGRFLKKAAQKLLLNAGP
jgi:hypothetical protein